MNVFSYVTKEELLIVSIISVVFVTCFILIFIL